MPNIRPMHRLEFQFQASQNKVPKHINVVRLQWIYINCQLVEVQTKLIKVAESSVVLFIKLNLQRFR